MQQSIRCYSVQQKRKQHTVHIRIGHGHKLGSFAWPIVHHKTVGVTADELNDQVQDDGSGYLEKSGYSTGISTTGQNVMLTIEDEEK
ncbi:hypothetical protein [Bifidobacterium polysaccharolyticum]|uniref:hypothetical protein n=2 Tax=Bifidobacterium TaxID=1678 RepID=UPI001181D5DA|nr:hypothetical protein [Bifidobacterium polysaccharolyticum]